MNSEILVSIVVITYNSEKYIIETLESIKNQTYEKIELVVADDKSTDNTVTIVKEWIDKNKDRFFNYKIVINEVNSGITKNCNNGILASEGEYIKLIAGDDILLENCVSDLLEYVFINNLNFAYGKIIPFTDTGDKNYEEKMKAAELLSYSLYQMDVKHQYRKLLKDFSMFTIGLFFKKQFMVDIGCFDEKYKMMEDYPFVIKVTSMGYKLNLLDSYVAKYRVRAPETRKSFFATKRKSIHACNLSSFQENELLPRMKKEKMYFSMYELYINMIADKINNSNDGLFYSYLSRIIRYLSLSTIAYKIKISILESKNNKTVGRS